MSKPINSFKDIVGTKIKYFGRDCDAKGAKGPWKVNEVSATHDMLLAVNVDTGEYITLSVYDLIMDWREV